MNTALEQVLVNMLHLDHFFKKAWDGKRRKYEVEFKNLYLKSLNGTKVNESSFLSNLGQKASIDLEQSIINFKTPGNAPWTIKAKGFDDPLIETRHMLNSVRWEVVEHATGN